MKPGYRVIGAFLSLLLVLVCGNLTRNGSRLLMKPVLAIVKESVFDPAFDAVSQPQAINPDEQEGKSAAQTDPKTPQDNSSENTAEKTLVEQILNHQSQEGNAILQEEVRLRLQEIREQLDLFGREQKQILDSAVETKSESLNQELERGLQDKAAENQVALHKFEQELEESQKVNLVNIRLRLMAISFDRKSNSFNEEEQELNDRIEQIRQEISRKAEDKKSQFLKDYQQFEIVAQQSRDKELAEYKIILEKAFQKEYSALKEKLERELQTWRDNQEKNLNEAIRLRKNRL